jgi:hypothetical protein
MSVFKGRKTNPRRVECCAVRCQSEELNDTVTKLNDDGWSIRQIFQEAGQNNHYVYQVFSQKETPVETA